MRVSQKCQTIPLILWQMIAPPVIFQMRDADAETFQCPEALIVEIQRAVIQTEN